VVDDEATVRRVLQMRPGTSLASGAPAPSDGEEALTLFHREQPDLVVSRLDACPKLVAFRGLPGVCGLNPAVPIIFLSRLDAITPSGCLASISEPTHYPPPNPFSPQGARSTIFNDLAPVAGLAHDRAPPTSVGQGILRVGESEVDTNRRQ